MVRVEELSRGLCRVPELRELHVLGEELLQLRRQLLVERRPGLQLRLSVLAHAVQLRGLRLLPSLGLVHVRLQLHHRRQFFRYWN